MLCFRAAALHPDFFHMHGLCFYESEREDRSRDRGGGEEWRVEEIKADGK